MLPHHDEPLMKVTCNEPEGPIEREVRLCELTVDKLKFFYDKLSQFEVLFNDHTQGNVDEFIKKFLIFEKDNVTPTGLIWEVDDVGIVYLTDIVLGLEAKGHFTFWDKRLRGREQLVKNLVKHWFESYGLHRVVAEIPPYAPPAMAFAERVGMQKEGRKREAIRYKGEWFDILVFSILESEV